MVTLHGLKQLGCFLLLALFGGCSGAANGLARHPGRAETLAWEATFLKTPEGGQIAAESAVLRVPERHGQVGGGSVELALLRFRSTAAAPAAPIVYLSGGPGGSGTAAARGPLLGELLALSQVADVIALDQRGTGLSRPALVCRESWSHPLDRLVGKDELLVAARERSRRCATMLRAAGHDLDGYSTVESADDLEDLRQALGVPRLQLLGVSYGTQLALTAMRRHPTRWERVALLSAKGTQHGLRLPSVFEQHLRHLDSFFPESSRSSRQGSGWVDDLARVLRQLEQAPVRVEVPLPQASGSTSLVVGAFDLRLLVVQALASRTETARLPAQIERLARGDFVPLGRYALGLRRGWLGSAMPYLVECSSGLAAPRRERIRREAATTLLGEAVDFPFPDICSGWQVGDLGNPWRRHVRSRIPTLVVAGTGDVRTPLEDAREILAELPEGVLLTAEGVGHGEDFFAAPALGAALRRFFSGQSVEPRTVTLPSLALAADPSSEAPER